MATSIAAPTVAERLEELWRTEPGLVGALTTVDHKKIGKRYLVTALLFLVLGGCEALIMRLQLAGPNESLLTPDQYNQLFSMHGVTMIFLYASPILSGFGNYLWPIVVGARDMAFPRLNAFSYWNFLFSGIFIYTALVIGQAPNDGWFNYVPFASLTYNPGLNMDFYALGLIFLTISTTVGAINFIVTLFKLRAPGMSINRLPILVWGTLSTSFAILASLPALTAACLMLYLDRRFGMHFFDANQGGSPLLWQHLFWIFGHPWVYIIVLPAMSIASEITQTFSRRPLVGYVFLALATVATTILGFGVWVHHMFATGLPAISTTFFSAASFIIAIPSAVTIFALIATIWHGKPVFRTPLLFVAGFIVLFVLGGVSGVATAAVPYDWQLTDTYFVVAHIHYVLIGINLFPVIGGLYYWVPKFTGRMMNERMGRWNFWTMFIGFNLGFFPMHIAGLLGMPRRIYTYQAGLGWHAVNLLTTLGAFLFAFGVLMFFVNFFYSRKRGELAGENPWDGPTLEWAVPSPVPPYNFAEIPTVHSRLPLWEGRLDGTSGIVHELPPLAEGHETIGTTPLDAEKQQILHMPGDSWWPLLTTLAITAVFYGLVGRIWWLAIAAGAIMLLCTAMWLWPTHVLEEG